MRSEEYWRTTYGEHGTFQTGLAAYLAHGTARYLAHGTKFNWTAYVRVSGALPSRAPSRPRSPAPRPLAPSRSLALCLVHLYLFGSFIYF